MLSQWYAIKGAQLSLKAALSLAESRIGVGRQVPGLQGHNAESDGWVHISVTVGRIHPASGFHCEKGPHEISPKWKWLWNTYVTFNTYTGRPYFMERRKELWPYITYLIVNEHNRDLLQFAGGYV